MVHPCDAKEVADAVLEEWDDVCKEMGIKHMLILGTCLGMVRDKGYIKGDNDIDVWIEQKNIEKLKTLMRKRNYKLGKHWGTNQHFRKEGVLLDVWWDSDFPNPLDEITYNGRVYNVPHPIEEYLKKCYGDWKIPSKRKGH